ncbi:MAG: thioredoxin family protein [Syntrophomonadaceae bacterium]|jgi:thiol-disulfide isomerase/thioredoxin|nr:thioredoxin family protein [Syntrophomonadaceae bacterium]MDH7498120.1 thioredoxin family protein [Syntrophomonadaceae bacterium]
MNSRLRPAIMVGVLLLVLGIAAARFAWPRAEGPAQLPSTPSQTASPVSSDGSPGGAPGGEEAARALPVWMLFRSEHCAPCVEMTATMKRLGPEFAGRVEFRQVDVDDPANRDVVREFGIRYVPTTYLYDADGRLVFQQIGAVPEDEMRERLRALLEKR